MADLSQVLYMAEEAARRLREASNEATRNAESEWASVEERVVWGSLANVLGQYADSVEAAARSTTYAEVLEAAKGDTS